MARLTSILCILISTALLSGCTGYKRSKGFSNGAPQVVAAPDSVSALLADAADRAATALQTLAAVEHHRTPNATIAPVQNAPTELRRAVTVNWIGPVEVLTQSLAQRASYSFRSIGSQPPTPVVVSIDVENRPIIDVLRDIGLQMGARADVKVDSDRHIIEVHYPPAANIDLSLSEEELSLEELLR